MEPQACVIRTGTNKFLPTRFASGAWDPENQQHGVPLVGLLADCIEKDRDERRDDNIALSRLAYEFWGAPALKEFHVEVEVLRPGKTIELVEARAIQSGRNILVLRAWLMQKFDTAALSGSPLQALKSPVSN